MSALPKGWVESLLSELTGIDGLMTDGDWIETKDQDQNGEVRLIQLADVGEKEFVNKSNRFLTLGKAEELRCTFLKEGDVLIARMPDPLGRACVFPSINKPCVTAVDVCIWRSGEFGMYPNWIMYIINSPDVRNKIELLASGTTRKRISGGNLKRLSLPVPPLNEQRRIVAKLDRLFARSRRARKELERVHGLCDRYKQAVLAAAFRGDLTVDWRKENSSELLSNYEVLNVNQLDDLPNLPDEWIWTSISQVAEVTGGLTKNQSRAGLEKKVPYLRVANVYANELRLDEILEIGITETEWERVKLKAGDLLIVEGNGSIEQIGRVALWHGEIEQCAHQNHLIKARIEDPAFQKFALYWLLSPSGRRAIEQVASSSAGLHTLSISKVSALPIPVCSIGEMEVIVKSVEKLFVSIDLLEQEYQKASKLLDRLEQATLAKAFRGELVPQDPNDEPASVLLERIQAERQNQKTSKRGRNKQLELL